jgi:hypothetical protein
MKKALILDNEVVDVANSEFPVAESLIWMDCPDDCKAYRWSIIDGVLQENPEPEDTRTIFQKRIAEYPPIGDQLDMIYHNGDGGATFQAAIKAVKDKYPKE